MMAMTAEDHNNERYLDDHMLAYNLRWRPTPPAIQGFIDGLRQSPPVDKTPKLTGLDRAVLAAQEADA